MAPPAKPAAHSRAIPPHLQNSGNARQKSYEDLIKQVDIDMTGAARLSRRYADLEEKRYLLAKYEKCGVALTIARRLRDDPSAWEEPGWLEYWQDHNQLNRTKPLGYAFQFTYGAQGPAEEDRARRHGNACEIFFEQNVSALDLPALITKAGGLRKLRGYDAPSAARPVVPAAKPRPRSIVRAPIVEEENSRTIDDKAGDVPAGKPRSPIRASVAPPAKPRPTRPAPDTKTDEDKASGRATVRLRFKERTDRSVEAGDAFIITVADFLKETEDYQDWSGSWKRR